MKVQISPGMSDPCQHCITITCPCNVYPLLPHIYIAILGFAGVYLFFLFLLQNIRLWVLIRTASPEAVLTCTHNPQKEEKISKIFY